MKNFLLLLIVFQFNISCNSQIKNNNVMNDSGQNLVTREPVVAGQFYPDKADELKSMLQKLFSEATPCNTDKEVLAIISPHAGYVFSGEVAASSFNQLNYNKKYKNIFIIGSSHRTSFNGASIYNKGNFKTPLGIVPVNIELANQLIQQYDFFNDRVDAQLYEHSLEVQLPFLQYRMKNDYCIVPIVIATQNRETCRKIASALKPYFNSDNLFIISTDFSHYPSYENAQLVDQLTANAIITNKPEELIKTLDANDQKGITNLATSLCGWTSVLTLMYITEKMDCLKNLPVDYKNSCDAKYYGENARVVGYYSIAVVNENYVKNNDVSEEFLNNDDKKTLLSLARKTIEKYIDDGEFLKPDVSKYSPALQVKAGAFVTLHKNGKLRGCIGRFDADEPLYKIVQEMAIASATRDYRFTPVTAAELPEIDIEISVLTPLRKIHSIDEIVLGKHGIYIKKGMQSGTFLPQVATDTKWSLEEFLGHCARDKAGIGWDGWKDAEIFVYEAIVFSE